MIDFYLPKRKLAIEVDELGHEDRKKNKENKENKRQKELEECLKCTFIRINPDEEDFSAYDGLGKIDAELEKLKDKIKELKKTKNH